MKILHIIPTYVPASSANGPHQPIHSLNKELVKQGVEVTVYTSNRDGRRVLDVPVGQEVRIDGVKVIYFPLTFNLWHYSWQLHQALKRYVKDFDVIHISSLFLSYLTLGAYYARKYNVPYIITAHGMLMKIPLASKWPKKKLFIALFDKKNIAEAATLHCTTNLEMEEYRGSSLPKIKTIVIPNIFSPEAISPILPIDYFRQKFSIANNKKIVLFLGRLNWIKGFETLLSAFAKIIEKNQDAFLVLAGPDGGYKKKIEFLVKKFNLKEYILFTGLLSEDEKNSALQSSTMFVLSSSSENFSIATCEAMSAGLPVVITKNIGIAPLVEKYSAGIVVEKNNEDLAHALETLLQDSEQAKRMGENGRKLVALEFAASGIALQMKNAYEEVRTNKA